jgi:hypothetical protein
MGIWKIGLFIEKMRNSYSKTEITINNLHVFKYICERDLNAGDLSVGHQTRRKEE